MRTLFYYFTLWTARLLLTVFFGMRVRNRRLVPRRGGLILASNHASHLDPPLVSTALAFRQTNFMARSTLFRNPLFGWLIRTYRAHPVVRGQGPNQDWDLFVKLVQAGGVLLVFPEGTRTPDGRLQRGKSGFGKLVHMSKVPVYPVYIDGSHAAFPKGGEIRLTRITVTFGPPVDFGDLLEKPDEKRFLREISEVTMRAIAALQSPHPKPGARHEN